MSHFSRIKTRIVEKEYLLLALRDLKYGYEEGKLDVGGFGGDKRKVDIKIKLPFSYDIGFMETKDGYELVADWWGVQGIKKDVFLNQLMQRYAYHAARAKLEAQGFDLVEEKVEKTGEIRLTMRRMA